MLKLAGHLCVFEASLVYRVSSRTGSKPPQRNPILREGQKPNKQTKNGCLNSRPILSIKQLEYLFFKNKKPVTPSFSSVTSHTGMVHPYYISHGFVCLHVFSGIRSHSFFSFFLFGLSTQGFFV